MAQKLQQYSIEIDNSLSCNPTGSGGINMKTIMVIGAGQMGGGIAQVAAQAGYSVILNDIKDEFVMRGLGIIEKNNEFILNVI